MALTKIGTDGVKDDAVTSDKVANSINTAIAANTAKTQTTINNNADNRVITGSGTANTLNGESGLTYDGSVLQVNGDGQFTGNDGTANQLKWDKSDDSLYFRDSVKAQFGTGGDLQLFHDGGDSYVSQTGTGNLILQGNASNNIAIRAKSGEEGINLIPDGAVELYYDDVKKFETTSSGATVTGSLGIGKTPTDRLDVQTTHSSGGRIATFYNSDSGNNGGLIIQGGGSDGEARLQSAGGSSFLTFYTEGGNLAERLRINSSGNLFLGKTSQSSGTAGVELYADGPNFMTRNGTTVLGLNNDAGTNGDIMRFYFQDVHKGNLNFSSGSFSATTASDYRLKENDTPITDGITRIKQLRPVRFNWKASHDDPTKTHDGFIAHELQAVMPDCVTGEKDGEITAKGEGYQAISREGLIPLLTAGLKDAIAKIETLETKVAALEAD